MAQNNQIGVIQVIVVVYVMFLILLGCVSRKKSAVNADETETLNVANVGEVNWNQVKENTWQLVSIRKGGTIITLDRDNNEKSYIYTLCFTGNRETRILGRGSANYYSALCEFGDDPAIGFSNFVSTKITPFLGQDTIKEHEYFEYLEKVDLWSMDEAGHLMFASIDGNGERVFLVFRKMQGNDE